VGRRRGAAKVISILFCVNRSLPELPTVRSAYVEGKSHTVPSRHDVRERLKSVRRRYDSSRRYTSEGNSRRGLSRRGASAVCPLQDFCRHLRCIRLLSVPRHVWQASLHSRSSASISSQFGLNVFGQRFSRQCAVGRLQSSGKTACLSFGICCVCQTRFYFRGCYWLSPARVLARKADGRPIVGMGHAVIHRNLIAARGADHGLAFLAKANNPARSSSFRSPSVPSLR